MRFRVVPIACVALLAAPGFALAQSYNVAMFSTYWGFVVNPATGSPVTSKSGSYLTVYAPQAGFPTTNVIGQSVATSTTFCDLALSCSLYVGNDIQPPAVDDPGFSYDTTFSTSLPSGFFPAVSPSSAQGELTDSGVDLSQLPASVLIGGASVLAVALALGIVYLLRRSARLAGVDEERKFFWRDRRGRLRSMVSEFQPGERWED